MWTGRQRGTSGELKFCRTLRWNKVRQNMAGKLGPSIWTAFFDHNAIVDPQIPTRTLDAHARTRTSKGDTNEGYDMLVPLDRNSRIDPVEWKNHPHLCRIRRFRAKTDPSYGHLRCKPDGQWYINILMAKPKPHSSEAMNTSLRKNTSQSRAAKQCSPTA